MSSRKGNIVPLMNLVKGMQDLVKTKYLSRYESDWSATEIDLVASQVAKGAIKYGMLRIDPSKKIVFDMEEWLKIDGESGPFIQYSFARISSLVRKLNFDINKTTNWSLLTHPAEHQLATHIMNFNGVALSSTENYRPSTLCTYLYELAKKFNYFYHECSISGAETEDLKHARLALSVATGNTLKKGLELLGIPVPERM